MQESEQDMKQAEFKDMWEAMQSDGYFSNHPHYSDYFGKKLTDEDMELDEQVLALDFSSTEIYMPVPYSEALERSVKRTESTWLPKTFTLPQTGVALDEDDQGNAIPVIFSRLNIIALPVS